MFRKPKLKKSHRYFVNRRVSFDKPVPNITASPENHDPELTDHINVEKDGQEFRAAEAEQENTFLDMGAVATEPSVEVPETYVQETRTLKVPSVFVKRKVSFDKPVNDNTAAQNYDPELTDHSNVEKYSQPEDKPAYAEDRFAGMIVTNEKSEDDMQFPCIVKSEDKFRDAPEAPTVGGEDVPEIPTDITEDFPEGDIGLVDLHAPKLEVVNTPLLCGVKQMGERLTNVKNIILEAEHDGLKYLKLNDIYNNFRQDETQATAVVGADPSGQQPKIQEDDEEPVTNSDRAKAIKIETNDQINFKHSDVKLRADAVADESTEEITVAQVDNSAISKWTEANKKLIKIMAQIRIKNLSIL